MALELLSLLCTFENFTECGKVGVRFARLRFFFRIVERSTDRSFLYSVNLLIEET